MRATLSTSLNLIVLIGVSVFAAVSFHSVQEIHYLKSFFPRDFTVDEAFYAAIIELIKVIIIGLPIVLIIGVCLAKLRERKTE
jgi:magnesium-transporting ATPase (P-type)